MRSVVVGGFAVVFLAIFSPGARGTTKGLSQIVTPDLQSAGDVSLSFQAQSERIANPFQLQSEIGLTNWAEVAVFKGFKPDELIFGTEFGLVQKEPYLLSAGFVWKSGVIFQVNPSVDELPAPLWKSTWARHCLLKS